MIAGAQERIASSGSLGFDDCSGETRDQWEVIRKETRREKGAYLVGGTGGAEKFRTEGGVSIEPTK